MAKGLVLGEKVPRQLFLHQLLLLKAFLKLANLSVHLVTRLLLSTTQTKMSVYPGSNFNHPSLTCMVRLPELPLSAETCARKEQPNFSDSATRIKTAVTQQNFNGLTNVLDSHKV